MKRLVAWLATAATLTVALPGAASQTDPRLDGLFARLKAARDGAEADRIEQAIWRLWHVSGDAAVDGVMGRGLEALARRDYLAALEAFDAVVRAAPDFAEGWNKRATAYYLLGGYDASAADIERTLALEPRHFGALSGLGLVRLAQGDERAALDAFERALAAHPHLPGAETHIRALREKLGGRAI